MSSHRHCTQSMIAYDLAHPPVCVRGCQYCTSKGVCAVCVRVCVGRGGVPVCVRRGVQDVCVGGVTVCMMYAITQEWGSESVACMYMYYNHK